MKKFLFLVITMAAIASCKKNGADKKYCYRCHIASTWIVPERTVDTCSDVPANNFKFKDPANNDQSFWCENR